MKPLPALLLLLLVTACSPSSVGHGGPRPGVDPPGPEPDAGMPDADRPEDRGGMMMEDNGDMTVRDECGDGLDNNGDGEVDEACACPGGTSQSCYGGPVDVAGVGECHRGEQMCDSSTEFGSWGPCTGWVPPAEETCNGLDDDCDGTADEGCSCSIGTTRPCYTGPPGTEGVGICRPGMQPCDALADGSAGWGECVGSVLPDVERCNGLDDDCDGTIDEGCSCTPGDVRMCFERPDGTPGPGMAGVGICREGVRACIELPGGGSDFGPCIGAVFAEPETCGDGIDNDCDGEVDEGCVPPGTVDCSVADVLFLVDTTGSMGGEIRQIQTRLRDTIIPGLAREIRDVQFSVAAFDDFPVSPYGGGSDLPFRLLQASTSSAASAQAAVDRLGASGGADTPESQVEALYQTATGSGIGSWVAGRSCPGGTVGYPCFRAGATHIVVLITDAPFHNGPGSAYSYTGVFPSPHAYGDTVTALRSIDAKVLGLFSGSSGRDHLVDVARATGALRADGSPIVIDIGSDGSGLDMGVIDAVASLCR